MFSGEVILSIDPGIDNLGISVGVPDYNSGEFRVLEARTFSPPEYTKLFIPTHHQSIRDFKLDLIYQEVINTYDQYHFTTVATENNYFGTSAQAYKSLIEVVCSIESAVRSISGLISIHRYEPGVVKKTFGVAGNTGDKDAMKNALLSNDKVKLPITVSKMFMDEHTVDAVCIGYHHQAGVYNNL